MDIINSLKIGGIVILLGGNAPTLSSIDIHSLEGIGTALIQTGQNLAVSTEPLLQQALSSAQLEAERNGIRMPQQGLQLSN